MPVGVKVLRYRFDVGQFVMDVHYDRWYIHSLATYRWAFS